MIYSYSEGRCKTISYRVQFVVTDDEYEYLKNLVKERGVSISKYVKDKVFESEDSFKEIWDEFSAKLEAFPSNIEFDVSTVLSQERWRTLDKSSKLSIARLFSKKVTSHEYSDIVLVGRSSSNVSIYRKQNNNG